MGNCVITVLANCLNGTVECSRSMWKKITCQKVPRRTVVLLVLGLDDAGKSTIVNYLFNKSLLTEENVVPTIGFRTVTFNYDSFTIRLYDIGGGPQIRALWPKYYGDVHGVIYVVDANNIERLTESADVFQELVCHELISQKPILFLANKQDLENALDELDIIQSMNIEGIVNFAKCHTRIEICSCYPDKNKNFNLNKNINKGFQWLIEIIEYNYENLERGIRKKRIKRTIRRSFRLKSWTAHSIHNSFDSSDSDSDAYLKPIVPEDEMNHVPKKKKKRKSLKSIFKNNRTAPLPTNDNEPTTRTMKQLIKSMKIEDLIKNTHVDNNVSEYRRPNRRRRRRPNTAPAIVRPCEGTPIQTTESDMLN